MKCNCELIEHIKQRIRSKQLDLELEQMQDKDSRLAELLKTEIGRLNKRLAALSICDEDCAYKQAKAAVRARERALENRLTSIENAIKSLEEANKALEPIASQVKNNSEAIKRVLTEYEQIRCEL